MIVFLTLIYIALLLILSWLKVIRLNLAWKLSPVLWFIMLLVLLFIPMQWGAPSGPVGVFRYVIEIVPAVSGQVEAVPVQPLTPVKKGTVLFQIDPLPFQQEVDRLKAALVDAEQQPELLAASVKIAEASVETAKAEQARAQHKLKRSEELLKKQAISDQEYDNDVRTAKVGIGERYGLRRVWLAQRERWYRYWQPDHSVHLQLL